MSEYDSECHISSTKGLLKVTVENCQCAFLNTTNLPCRHIFAVRQRKNYPLFNSSLPVKRWTMEYMKDFCCKKSDSDSGTSSCSVSSYINY